MNGNASVVPSSDTRSPAAQGFHLASHVTTISLMMVLPAGGGYYADKYFGTLPLFMVLGLILGLTAGVWQLIRLAQNEPPKHEDSTSPSTTDESSHPN
jgi:F0F1-type ATP synthase assembly protein I